LGLFSNWFGTRPGDDDLPEILDDIDMNHDLSIGIQETTDYYDEHTINPASGLPIFAIADPSPFGLEIGKATISEVKSRYDTKSTGINIAEVTNLIT